MNKRDEERYLKGWGSDCFICKQRVEQWDKSLQESIVRLEKYPEWAGSLVIKYYMACPDCAAKGELV